MTRGLLLAAPSSGAGKTTLTLGLLRALKKRGIGYAPAKSGPDYIDPRFHELASGKQSQNLDAWAMTPARIQSLVARTDHVLIEAAMGLFDGAGQAGVGSAADLARILRTPIVLILDCAKQAHSIAAVLRGFLMQDESLNIAAVILNRVGSPRHEDMLRSALKPLGVPILGAVPNDKSLQLPERHLGLVQAEEIENIEAFIDRAATLLAEVIDLDQLHALAGKLTTAPVTGGMPPLGQRIAIARDTAFSFIYPHFIEDWRSAGAELSFFSPLADQAPDACDCVYLPGGYPELHASTLASNENFLNGLRASPRVFGECGGYMVMGNALIDGQGTAHQMAGLLDLVTSFETPKRHLGYRDLTGLGNVQGRFSGHEFHYASTIEAKGDPLFQAQDADGLYLGEIGLQSGPHAGSFAHIIDRRPE